MTLVRCALAFLLSFAAIPALATDLHWSHPLACRENGSDAAAGNRCLKEAYGEARKDLEFHRRKEIEVNDFLVKNREDWLKENTEDGKDAFDMFNFEPRKTYIEYDWKNWEVFAEKSCRFKNEMQKHGKKDDEVYFRCMLDEIRERIIYIRKSILNADVIL